MFNNASIRAFELSVLACLIGPLGCAAAASSDFDPSSADAGAGSAKHDEVTLDAMANPDEQSTQALSALSGISWADFTATQRVCTPYCVRTEWEQIVYCDEYGCWTEWAPYCAETGVSCRTARKPLPDGDIIDVTITHGATTSDDVQFQLVAAPSKNWWKQITITGGTDRWTVETQDGQSWANWPPPRTATNINSEWAGVILADAGEIIFSKAKFLGIHTDVYVLRGLAQMLRGGDRVTFRWVED